MELTYARPRGECVEGKESIGVSECVCVCVSRVDVGGDSLHRE